MAERKRIMYILMPFREDLYAVYQTLEDVAHVIGYKCIRSDKDRRSMGDILQKLIHGIFEADLVIADLTDKNPNVFYELGVANALSKDCVMIFQGSPAELPFDIRGFEVVSYKNDQEGLKALKADLLTILTDVEPIKGPVNTALEAQLKREKTVMYIFWGAIMGPLLSLLPSFISASIGASFLSYYQGSGFFRTVVDGAPPAFFGGAAILGTYSILFNSYGSKLKRRYLIFAETLATLIVGVITFALLFLLGVKKWGLEIAFGTATPYLIMFTLGGLAFGFSLNIQSLRDKPYSLLAHTLKSMAAFIFALSGFIALINLFKAQIFFPAYLEHYRLLDSVSDALRYCLWGIAFSTFQWWLKWEKRL